MSETTEKEKETGLKSLIDKLDKQQKVAFCSYLGLHGASFYTMRDKLVYGTGWFDLWELKGVEGMIREFDPDYEGEAEDFIARDGEKTAFATYMAETGGICGWQRGRRRGKEEKSAKVLKIMGIFCDFF